MLNLKIIRISKTDVNIGSNKLLNPEEKCCRSTMEFDMGQQFDTTNGVM